MRNTGLEEAQAGIKIARRNNNNLRDADDTTKFSEYGSWQETEYTYALVSLEMKLK